jgi:hypothetical protein
MAQAKRSMISSIALYSLQSFSVRIPNYYNNKNT